MTIGAISAFLLYMILLMFSFMIIGFSLTNVFKTIGASEKIVAIMRKVPTVNSHGGKHVESSMQAGEIEFKDVTFAYPVKRTQDTGEKKDKGGKVDDTKKGADPDANPPVLHKVSFKVSSNKVVAFVGHSGCGKSSIINLVERFYDPQAGAVEFCGVNIKDLEPAWYKTQVAIVQQEPVLFSGSIKDNIGYGLDEGTWTDADVEDACRKANALNFIQDKGLFPEGFDTLVGERGIKLSGGQK